MKLSGRGHKQILMLQCELNPNVDSMTNFRKLSSPNITIKAAPIPLEFRRSLQQVIIKIR